MTTVSSSRSTRWLWFVSAREMSRRSASSENFVGPLGCAQHGDHHAHDAMATMMPIGTTMLRRSPARQAYYVGCWYRTQTR